MTSADSMSAPMSARKIAKAVLLCGPLICVSLPAVAEEESPGMPELEFLEYLGSWETSDEDWLLFSDETERQVVADDSAKRDPTPQGEGATELKDES